MKKLPVNRLLAVTSLCLALSSPAIGCSDVKLTAEDGTMMVARTMEFGADLKSNLRSSPRGREFKTTTPNNRPGLSWKSKYGYLYLDGFGIDASFDGMNEAGMSFGYLYLPGETQYQTIPEGKDAQAIPYSVFGDWILSNFKTVDEVREALKNVYVSTQVIPQIGDAVLPAHATIRDASGKGIVVEFYNDKINVFDSMGIMTNAPRYDWHVTNLRNYINLSSDIPQAVTQGGMTYSATGQGSGAFGLPGDASPPSRFVKLAFMAANVYKVKDATALVNLAQHIMNNVDLPAGYVRSTENGKTETDITQWAVFKDLTHRMFYYRTYNDLTLRVIDMSKIDFSEKAARLIMPVEDAPRLVNTTDAFLKATNPAP
ncbi:linear amide C-N hydrolase [Legionella sp. CNM-4043-24]|uniref:linear amide C-N hydrolase n=1 Tax=Legionella sp. CNM-4043-24 TaxID=3421646 RepID=UPI00403B19BA